MTWQLPPLLERCIGALALTVQGFFAFRAGDSRHGAGWQPAQTAGSGRRTRATPAGDRVSSGPARSV